MTNEQRPLKVFLCHASQDKPAVRELAQRLFAEGWIDPWLDEKKLLPGQDWRLKIEEAVETSDIVVICLSSNSVTKEGFVQKELRYAKEIALEKPDGTIFLIPLRLDDCETPRGLRFFQWADYFGENKDEAFNALLGSLSIRFEQKLRLEELEHAQQEKKRLEQEATEKAERERLEQEKAAQEKLDGEAVERAAKQKAELEAADEAKRKKAEKEASEKAAREKIAREKADLETAERARRDKLEQEAAKKAKREKKEKEDAEKKRREELARHDIIDRGDRYKSEISKTKAGGGIAYWIAGFAVLVFGIGLLSSLNNLPPPASPTLTNTPSIAISTPLPLPIEIIDDFGVGMVLVPEGEFMMGTDRVQVSPEDVPAHNVNLDAFYIDKFEVTNILYQACVDAGPCGAPEYSSSSTRASYYGDPAYEQFPVTYVNWWQAKEYCEWRGANLPTETQWEKAARGTDKRNYPWGDDLNNPCGKYFSCQNDTTQVGSFESGVSPYGVYDMAGNVYEWTSSIFDPNSYDEGDGRNGLSSPDKRVLRGGSWMGDDWSVYSRTSYFPNEIGDGDFGFRCALWADESTTLDVTPSLTPTMTLISTVTPSNTPRVIPTITPTALLSTSCTWQDWEGWSDDIRYVQTDCGCNADVCFCSMTYYRKNGESETRGQKYARDYVNGQVNTQTKGKCYGE